MVWRSAAISPLRRQRGRRTVPRKFGRFSRRHKGAVSVAAQPAGGRPARTRGRSPRAPGEAVASRAGEQRPGRLRVAQAPPPKARELFARCGASAGTLPLSPAAAWRRAKAASAGGGPAFAEPGARGSHPPPLSAGRVDSQAPPGRGGWEGGCPRPRPGGGSSPGGRGPAGPGVRAPGSDWCVVPPDLEAVGAASAAGEPR